MSCSNMHGFCYLAGADEALISCPGYCSSHYGKVAPARQLSGKSREGAKTGVAG